MPELKLTGCRHDILGHYLKAIGLLRVLAKCAAPEYRDPDAEGWWNTADAAFYLRSEKYGSREKLFEFFTKYYQPTPVFSAWNTGGGLDEKKEVVFQYDDSKWQQFWGRNKAILAECLSSEPKVGEIPPMPEKEIILLRKPKGTIHDIDDGASIISVFEEIKGKKKVFSLSVSWFDEAKNELHNYLTSNNESLKKSIRPKGEFTKPVMEKLKQENARTRYIFDLVNEAALKEFTVNKHITVSTRIKESGKKSVMAQLDKIVDKQSDLSEALQIGREFYSEFQGDETDYGLSLRKFREKMSMNSAECLDSIFTTLSLSKVSNNPLFMNRGDAGASEIFRTFWDYYLKFRGSVKKNVSECLFEKENAKIPKGKGTPFFPDAIKSYNIGGGWVEEDYPFCALDYILAVEGAFAMRGSVSRTLGSNTRRFAAFPFVFDSGEEMVDDGNKVRGTAASLWFPLWNRPTTYEELSSYINDAQARLPGKDARFSSEFLRAIHAQGVDAGFSGWQEFRFKMKGSKVPWVTTSKHVSSGFSNAATLFNRAVAPLDESRFLDQFEIIWEKGGAVSAHSPHSIRATLNAAIENAAVAPNAENCLEILCELFRASKKIIISKSFSKKSLLQNPRFFDRFPMKEWRELLKDLENIPEFEIARAIASIVGLQKQCNDQESKVQPLLGSLLPLKLDRNRWYLPDDKDRSKQAVWSGNDLCRDLVSILQRRYMDSTKDDHPALQAVYPARLENIISFLNGELNDLQISRWIEALSLIGWHFEQQELEAVSVDSGDDPTGIKEDSFSSAFPLSYAALRTLLDLECAWQGDNYKRRRSQQPITQLCQCSADSLAQATTDALRWIGIWGVPNPWGRESRQQREVLSGAYVVRLNNAVLDLSWQIIPPERIAAAVCIPLFWRDRWRLHRMVTLPIFS